MERHIRIGYTKRAQKLSKTTHKKIKSMVQVRLVVGDQTEMLRNDSMETSMNKNSGTHQR